MPKAGPWALSVAVVAGLGLSACTAPAVERLALPVTGPEVYEQLEARRQAMTFMAVLRRVEPVAERECRQRNPRADCDFRILVDDRPRMPANAFQALAPDGRPIIVFTVGLIGDVRNEDELAFVMAHEAAHHILGHLGRMDEIAAMGAEIFGQLAEASGEASPAAIRNAQELGAAVGAQAYSKDFELEADALGTVITAKAGYDPLVGSEFFFRIPDPGNRFLGTHPPTADRVAVVRRVAAELGFR
jgi:predicted Zn-dependent protease